VIARLSGARRVIGSNQPRERLARRLYTERIDTRQPHVIDRACSLVTAALHSLWRVPAATVTLPVDTAAEAWCEERFGAAAQNLVLLVPTAGWGAKEWPARNFSSLARLLMDREWRVLINAGPGADPVATAIAAESRAELVACNLPQLIEVTRRVRLVVGGDTGPIHLAAALGVPVVALFGPTDPERTGPRFPGARVRVLRNALSRVDHRRHRQTEAGLAQITVDEVAVCALEQLAEVPTADESHFGGADD
jgi:heptosyltransferase-1